VDAVVEDAVTRDSGTWKCEFLLRFHMMTRKKLSCARAIDRERTSPHDQDLGFVVMCSVCQDEFVVCMHAGRL